MKTVGYNIKEGIDIKMVARTLGTSTAPGSDECWMSPNSYIADRARELGVLDTWFTPIQKEFEVGDWVVVLPSDGYYDNAEQGKAQQILGYSEGSSLPYRLLFSNGRENSYHDVREATQEEIAASKEKAFTNVKIAGYTPKVTAEGFSFGCQTFPWDHIDVLIDLLSRPEIEFQGSIREIPITAEILRRVKALKP